MLRLAKKFELKPDLAKTYVLVVTAKGSHRHWLSRAYAKQFQQLMDSGRPISIDIDLRDDLDRPVVVCTAWYFDGKTYEQTDPGSLSPDDVRALLLEQENRRRLKLEKAHALMAMRDQLDSKAKRQTIPQEVKVAVWQRDGGRCVECNDQAELEYDHVIPLAMGGSNTARNLQLLCARCNQRKGATLG